MGKYVYYPPTPQNILWIGQMADMAQSVIETSGIENSFLTIQRENGINLLRWKKDKLLIENNATEPYIELRNTALTGTLTSSINESFFTNKIVFADLNSCYNTFDTIFTDKKFRVIVDDGDGNAYTKEFLYYRNSYAKTDQTHSELLELTSEVIKLSGNSCELRSENIYIRPVNNTGELKLQHDTEIMCYVPKLIIKNDDCPILNIYNHETNIEDKPTKVEMETTLSKLTQEYKHYNATDKCEYNLNLNMKKGGVISDKNPLKYVCERDNMGVVTSDKLTLNGNIYYDKPALYAYTKGTHTGISLGDNNMAYPLYNPATINYSSAHWTSKFGAYYYGFEYCYHRSARIMVSLSSSIWASDANCYEIYIGKRGTTADDGRCRVDTNGKCQSFEIQIICDVANGDGIEMKFKRDSSTTLNMTMEQMRICISLIEYTN